jgi:MADS-box transcription factor
MHPTPPQNNPPMIPTHLPTHPGFQHVNHAPSASPPIPNGMQFDPRQGTPQPQGVSRPSSRNHIRRVSSNIGTQQHHATPPPPPPPQNGYAYMPNPSVYNPNAHHTLGHQPRPSQFAHFGPPPGVHHAAPPHQHQPMSQQSMPPHTMPSQAIPPHIQQHPQHPHILAQQTPTMGLSQPPHPQMPQVAQAYMSEQGRSSMPPAFPSEQQQQQSQRTVSLSEAPPTDQIPGPLKTEDSQSPPQQRSFSSKSRSIFTPIDDRGSVLARHFGVGPPTSPRNESVQAKLEHLHDELKDRKGPGHPVAPPPPPRAATEIPRPQSVTDIKPPARTNSSQLPPKRPQLKVQIPSENSDRGSATADSSSRDSAGNKTLTPAKANPDGTHSGVVLPPPSPSAGAILSAGAQGPPNPFARPPPPATAAQNSNAYSGNNNIETPISALPSRFVSDALLPSPSSFFPEWGFGRSGPDSNMLPSPLTFPTPAVQSGPSFAREDEQDKKRKSPDSGPSAEGAPKKAKT